MLSDTTLDSIFAQAELEAGLPPALVAARNPLALVSPVVFVERPIRTPSGTHWADSTPGGRRAAWTDDEEDFLRDRLGFLSLDEIAARLGRSRNAVKIRFTRRQFPAASKRPGWLTGRQVADILGVDIHNVMALHRRGLMPLVRLPGERGILVIRQVALYRWAVNPDHWPYFIRSVQDPARIADPHLRRLIERQKARWNDEWWTIGQVAVHHDVDHLDVNRYIHHGKIRAFDWGNWWIRRSEATRPGLVFWKGKGSGQAAYQAAKWTAAADAYILRARAEGLTWAGIAGRMTRDERSVRWRGLKLLKQEHDQ